MRREFRIPTMFGILIIIVSLVSTVLLFENIRNLVSHAAPDITPSEVKITNISDVGVTISWITTAQTSGTVNFGENSSLGKIASDDRNQTAGKTGNYSTHHVSLRYLKPSSQYYFKIISGGKTFDNNGQSYVVTTAPVISSPPPVTNPIYGMVQKIDQTPASGAIVYVNLPGVTALSTLVKPSGNWLLTLNNARTADLSNFVSLKGDEKLEIFVQAGADGTGQATTTITDASPVPQIVLGKTYNLTQSPTPPVGGPQTPQPTQFSPSTTPPATSSSRFSLPPVATSSPSLVGPASDSAIPAERPLFQGTGIPGQKVEIKIESPNPVTGSTTVDQNGQWTWTPPTNLPPGEHTVTVTITDSAGNPLKFIRHFTVLASGTQVTEPATPSASPKVSPSPSPTFTPLPTPTPTLRPSVPATASTTMTPGNLTPTFFITILGLTFAIIGFSMKLRWSH